MIILIVLDLSSVRLVVGCLMIKFVVFIVLLACLKES